MSIFSLENQCMLLFSARICPVQTERRQKQSGLSTHGDGLDRRWTRACFVSGKEHVACLAQALHFARKLLLCNLLCGFSI